MTMRWHSGGGGESTTTALKKEEMEAQPCESTVASSSSTASANSPMLGDDEPDSTSSTASLMMSRHQSPAADNANTMMMTTTRSSSQLQTADIVLGGGDSSRVAMDPDGDPPYHHSQGIDNDNDNDNDNDDTQDDQVEEETTSSSSASSSSSRNSKSGHSSSAQQSEPQPEDGVGAGVLDNELDDSDQEIPWKPQATQSTCEFTHTIVNYSQKRDSGCKKAEYSATTVDEFGNRWRLIVYVNGNGRASNHHLSLFLQVRNEIKCCRLSMGFALLVTHPFVDSTVLLYNNRSRMRMTYPLVGKKL
jgi:hypothetical protein